MPFKITLNRDSHLFAFVQGFAEHFRDFCGGRTHETDQDWNEAYDRGMNLAEWIRVRFYGWEA